MFVFPGKQTFFLSLIDTPTTKIFKERQHNGWMYINDEVQSVAN